MLRRVVTRASESGTGLPVFWKAGPEMTSELVEMRVTLPAGAVTDPLMVV